MDTGGQEKKGEGLNGNQSVIEHSPALTIGNIVYDQNTDIELVTLQCATKSIMEAYNCG